jgi:hypothetical protein
MYDQPMLFTPADRTAMDGFVLTESENQDFINLIVVVGC